jgi:hypothetical protein
MTPEHERYNANRNPRYGSVPSACPKKEEKERTGEKNGAPKGRKTNEWKVGVIAESLEQHFIDVPRNRVERKQSVCVPRFVAHVGDMKVAKIGY